MKFIRFDFDSFREIVDALMRNRSRSLLTGFGIFWGLFMLLFLIGGGNALRSKMMANFDGFATNTVVVGASKTTKPYKGFQNGRYWNMTYRDVERIRMMIPELEVVSPMIHNWNLNTVYGDRSYYASLKGVDSEHNLIEIPSIKYGRMLNSVDVTAERKVCVLGKRVYEALFPEGGDPCGKYVQMGSVFLRVVGVDVCTGNMSINGEASETITLPITVAAKIFRRGNTVDMISTLAAPGTDMDYLQTKLRKVLSDAHLFDPTDKDAMFFANTQEVFDIIDNLFRGINLLIWIVGIGTLLAGAIGVSNIMMVTVRERTIEIGIRRAIGALPGEILFQIMGESITLTLIAGCGGIIFSILLLQLLEKATGTLFFLSFWTAVTALALLAVLGVIAGLAPTARAMKIKPVDAMRDE